MSKHTPGPWVVEDNNGYGKVICKDGGSMVAVWPSALDGTPFPAEANARLIAVAPDMMELLEHPLLQRMLGEIEDLQTEETAHIWALAVQWMELRDLLIAKATGESE